jgi:hypothetical protein
VYLPHHLVTSFPQVLTQQDGRAILNVSDPEAHNYQAWCKLWAVYGEVGGRHLCHPVVWQGRTSQQRPGIWFATIVVNCPQCKCFACRPTHCHVNVMESTRMGVRSTGERALRPDHGSLSSCVCGQGAQDLSGCTLTAQMEQLWRRGKAAEVRDECQALTAPLWLMVCRPITVQQLKAKLLGARHPTRYLGTTQVIRQKVGAGPCSQFTSGCGSQAFEF